MNKPTIIFDDDISAVAMMEFDDSALPRIAIRWLPPKLYKEKNGNLVTGLQSTPFAPIMHLFGKKGAMH